MGIIVGALRFKKSVGRFVFPAALLAVACFYLGLNNGTWTISPDSVTYVEGARSLAKLTGYANWKGTPITFFPPGTSLAYVLPALIPHDDYFYFNLLTKLLLLAYLAFSYLFFERRQGRVLALFGFLFLSFSILCISQSSRILSDIPLAFVFAGTLVLFPIEKLENASHSQLVVLGLLITACFLIRASGIYVFLGYFSSVLLMVRHDRKKILVSITSVFLIGALLWKIRNSVVSSGNSYFEVIFLKHLWVTDSGTLTIWDFYLRFRHNLQLMLLLINQTFSNNWKASWDGAVMGTVAAVGFLIDWKDKFFLFCLSFLLFFLPIHFLVEDFQRRFLLPVMPILLLFLLNGIRRFCESFKQKISRRIAVTGVALLLLINPYWIRGYRTAQSLDGQLDRHFEGNVSYLNHEDFQQLISDLNSRLKPGEAVAIPNRDVGRYLFPDYVKVEAFLLSENVDKAYSDLQKKNVNYLCADMNDNHVPYMLHVVNKYQPNFQLVSANKKAAIYRTRF